MSSLPPPPPPPPPSGPPSYEVPPPPPPINLKLLWHSLLWPPALAVLATIVFVFTANTDGYEILTSSMILCVVVCVPVVLGWGFFIASINTRYRGFSLVLLILAYPLLQGIIMAAIVFLGCVTLSYQ